MERKISKFEQPSMYAAAIRALENGCPLVADDRFLAAVAVGARWRGEDGRAFSHAILMEVTAEEAGQAYRESGRTESGRAFVHRALEMLESEIARNWLHNSFLFPARLAHDWQLHADEERLLKRELAFREKSADAGYAHQSGEILGQLVDALKAQGKVTEATQVLARRCMPWLTSIWKFRYPIAVALGTVLCFGLVLWHCGVLAALALAVLAYKAASLLAHVAFRDLYGPPVKYDPWQKLGAEIIFYVGIAVMALGLLGWISRDIALYLNWWRGTWDGMSAYPEWLYYSGWAVATASVLFLRAHIQDRSTRKARNRLNLGERKPRPRGTPTGKV